MNETLKSAGSMLAKSAALRVGTSFIKRSSYTTLAIGAAIGTGYLIYKALNKEE